MTIAAAVATVPMIANPRQLRQPIAFMMALSFINYLGFAGWSALLYNFTVERAGFDWAEAGLTQSVREIPGFLAFTAIFWLIFMREQMLAYAALFILGLGVALTGQFPTLTGVLITTFVMSVGFHYFETANASLQLQLLPKAEAPRLMGMITAAGACGVVRGLRRAGDRLVGWAGGPSSSSIWCSGSPARRWCWRPWPSSTASRARCRRGSASCSSSATGSTTR